MTEHACCVSCDAASNWYTSTHLHLQPLEYNRSHFSATGIDPDKSQSCQKTLFDSASFSNKDLRLGSHAVHPLTDWILWLCTASHFCLRDIFYIWQCRVAPLYSQSWPQAALYFSLCYKVLENIQYSVSLCVPINDARTKNPMTNGRHREFLSNTTQINVFSFWQFHGRTTIILMSAKEI